MKFFGELSIQSRRGAEELRECIRDIEQSIPPGSGWQRNRLLEQELGDSSEYFCFSCSEEGFRRAATLWLSLEPSRLRVSNIIPLQRAALSYDEYNSILKNFYERLVRSVADKRELAVELKIAEKSLPEWAGGRLSELLEDFARRANPSTGAAHLSDKKRWFAFIVAAHQERADLDLNLLERWLHEDKGFPADIAFKLVAEYEEARKLLAFYDSAA